jgi:hypothetical protein
VDRYLRISGVFYGAIFANAALVSCYIDL